MPNAGDIAVLQFGNDGLWHYSFLTPSALSTLTVNAGAGTVALTGIGSASGNVMAVPAPMASMNVTLSLPLSLTGTTLSINLATVSTPGLMTAAQFASIAALGTASTQATGAFATAAQGTKADSAIQPGNSGLIVADTGWTANANSGGKTVAIPAQVSSTAVVASLDPTGSLGLANLFAYYAASAEKCKAIESVLSTSLRPNA